MVASPDRIESDQGYVADSIRLVFWFVNRWKGHDDPQNFDRLYGCLRMPADTRTGREISLSVSLLTQRLR